MLKDVAVLKPKCPEASQFTPTACAPIGNPQAALVTDPEAKFRFSTRSQAVRDTPWRDWSGISFHPVRLLCRPLAAAAAGPLHACVSSSAQVPERTCGPHQQLAWVTPALRSAGQAVQPAGVPGCRLCCRCQALWRPARLPARTVHRGEGSWGYGAACLACQQLPSLQLLKSHHHIFGTVEHIGTHTPTHTPSFTHTAHSVTALQREYWREREPRDGAPLWVEYGNDVDGSLFLREDALGATRWNLNVRALGGAGWGKLQNWGCWQESVEKMRCARHAGTST